MDVAGDPTDAVLIAPADSPEFAMPAAGWAAKSGQPVLWTLKDSLPPETRAAIQAHKKPRIYVLGPEDAVGESVVKELEKLGTTKRVSGPDPITNAIAFARYSDGPRFGWNVVDPGHGVVFANASRTLDAVGRRAVLRLGPVRPSAAPQRRHLTPHRGPGLPARHPARLRRGPGARGLQSRLAHG